MRLGGDGLIDLVIVDCPIALLEACLRLEVGKICSQSIFNTTNLCSVSFERLSAMDPRSTMIRRGVSLRGELSQSPHRLIHESSFLIEG